MIFSMPEEEDFNAMISDGYGIAVRQFLSRFDF
jgi:hypothetical protein